MKEKKPKSLATAIFRIGTGVPLARIALVADLHDRPYAEVVRALKQQKPDLIAIAGDLMEKFMPDDIEEMLADLDEEHQGSPAWKKALYRLLVKADVVYGRLSGKREREGGDENAYALLRAAADIAPVYYALGNHERFLAVEDRQRIAATGAVLLDNASARLCLPQCDLLIGGMSSRYQKGWLEAFSSQRRQEPGFVRGLPVLKVLICHHPEYYERFVKGKDVDLVLSGHAHGGQWRFGNRGLFAPGQGFFPKYTGGLYENKLVVSRGLANTAHVPRVNNPPELVMVEILSENDPAGLRPPQPQAAWQASRLR
ncbi:MAG: metallophosphoesterase [Clostridia bacterium]